MMQVWKAQDWEVEVVARHLREEDDREVRTASGMEPKDALLSGYRTSRETWRVQLDGCPIAIFGVKDDPVLIGVGVPWFVGTPETRRIARPMLASAPNLLDSWTDLWYSHGLRNVVDVRNHMHVRWLQRIGCAFDYPPVEINQHLFLPFSWRLANV